MGINAIGMSSAISSSGMYTDPEHQRIIRELRAYGVEPTGDKSTDKAKLQKIESEKASEKAKSQKIDNNSDKQNAKQTQETANDVNNGAGSDQIAMLNKLRFGLI